MDSRATALPAIGGGPARGGPPTEWDTGQDCPGDTSGFPAGSLTHVIREHPRLHPYCVAALSPGSTGYCHLWGERTGQPPPLPLGTVLLLGRALPGPGGLFPWCSPHFTEGPRWVWQGVCPPLAASSSWGGRGVRPGDHALSPGSRGRAPWPPINSRVKPGGGFPSAGTEDAL